MQTIHIENTQKETYILDKYATLADKSVMLQVGGTTLLCSICIDYENPSNEDFLPLSVQYLEKMYAVGKIPQGFIKKEGKPSDNEILTSRLIDRSLRPLFPKDYPYPIQITILVLSYDSKTDLCTNALNLASICLYLSSIPITKNAILNGVRLIEQNREFQVCTDMALLSHSSLDLFVSGIAESITMIEMQAQKTIINGKEEPNEIPEERLLEAIEFARKHIDSMTARYTESFAPFVSPKREYKNEASLHALLKNTLQNQYGDSIKACLKEMSKTERHTQMNTLIARIAEEQNLEYTLASRHIYAIKKEIMRDRILCDGVRADGRMPTEIRHIEIESNPLAHTHGSACFSRGQTQALVTCTLGSQNDIKPQEGISAQRKSNVLFHYNFPPFSVGEAAPIGASSRRELGHSNLALKAIESNIATTSYAIRLVSEILQSNGSSSMASVCGAVLALLGADVKMHNMVAGIAMGLVYENSDNFVVLSDIMGIEDFDGDMDFKIAGNEKGFTALQLDMKIDGLPQIVLQKSLRQARDGILSILATMRAVTITPNYALLPQKESFCVPQGRIGEIIGQGGRTIREIIAKFSVHIELDKEESKVTLIANNKDSLLQAKEYILELLRKRERKELPYKVGEIYEGVVSKQGDIGYFIDLPQGGNGLLRSMNLIESLHIGQTMAVKITACQHGKIELEIPENKAAREEA